MDGIIGPIISLLGGLCDCVSLIAVIGGGLWFFVFRNKGAVDTVGVGAASVADDTNRALDNASAAFASDEEDDVATVVAPQPKPVSDAAAKPARPPRSAGATIIAFDDDDLLDD